MASRKTDFLCTLYYAWVAGVNYDDLHYMWSKNFKTPTITRPNSVGKTPVSGGTLPVQPLLGQNLDSLNNWGESVAFMPLCYFPIFNKICCCCCCYKQSNFPEFSNKDKRNRHCLTALVRVTLYGTLKNSYTDFSEWWLTLLLYCITTTVYLRQ